MSHTHIWNNCCILKNHREWQTWMREKKGSPFMEDKNSETIYHVNRSEDTFKWSLGSLPFWSWLREGGWWTVDSVNTRGPQPPVWLTLQIQDRTHAVSGNHHEPGFILNPGPKDKRYRPCRPAPPSLVRKADKWPDNDRYTYIWPFLILRTNVGEGGDKMKILA